MGRPPAHTERETPSRRLEPRPLHAPEPQPPGPWRDRQSDEQDERPAGSHVVVIDLD
ncbi:MAG: hypothetical protein KJO07_20890 [Deltaproteobacteria bacterium]|nr:hypothetical protein [Deltaproteobacteria bacterium]